MKKLLAVFLALMMVLSVSLVACSDKKDKNNENDDTDEDEFIVNTDKDKQTTDANTTDTKKDDEGESTKAPSSSDAWVNESGTLYVRANGVNIRAAASSSATSVGKANMGASFAFEAKNDTWYKIKYNGNTAYIAASFVTGNQNDVIFEAPTKVAANSAIHVKADATIFLRHDPAVADATLAGSIDSTKTANGELVIVKVSKSGSWAEVRFTGTDIEKKTYDGTEVLYCHTGYITELANSSTNNPSYG